MGSKPGELRQEVIDAMEQLATEFDRRFGQNPDDALAWARQVEPEEPLGEQEVAGLKAGWFIDGGGAAQDREAVTEGVKLFRCLTDDHPERLDYAYNLANGLSRLHAARPPVAPERYLETAPMRREARNLYASVASAAPERAAGGQRLAARAKTNQANLLKNSYRWLEAYDAYRDAVNLDLYNPVAAYGAAKILKWFADRGFPQEQHLRGLARQYRQIGKEAEKASSGQMDAWRREMKAGLEDGFDVDVPEVDLTGANPYARFVAGHDLALSLAIEDLHLKHQHWDTLLLGSVTQDMSKATAEPPAIFGMFNTLKSDYAAARWLAYQALFGEPPEAAHYADTLNYANYGIEQSLLTLAQRSAIDLLDRVAVAVTEYLDLGGLPLKKIYFRNRWHKDVYADDLEWQSDVAAEIERGNWALIALSELAEDFARKGGFLSSKKDARNASTHRFVILHEMGTPGEGNSDYVEHRGEGEFAKSTLDSLRVARAAIFYLAELVALREARMSQQDGLAMPMEIPLHHEIRGNEEEKYGSESEQSQSQEAEDEDAV